MKINIKGINDLYFERYITTKKMIDKFHDMINNEEAELLEQDPDDISINLLNNMIEEYSKKK